MNVKTAFIIEAAKYNQATEEVLLNGGSNCNLYMEFLRTGRAVPILLNRDSYDAASGGYPMGSTISGTGDTSVAAEDSGFTGDGTAYAFTGQDLNHLTVLPFSTVVYYINAASATKKVYDKKGDGTLYTYEADSTDEIEAGTINYVTGAIAVTVPNNATWIPKNAEKLYANYKYATALGSTTMAGIKTLKPYPGAANATYLGLRFMSVDTTGALVSASAVVDMNF